jgi:SnoaL-like domain
MEDAVRLLLDKDRIVDTINQLFIATDKRDWPQVRGCFADAVHFDMTSMGGGSPGDLTPAQIATGWEEGLRPIEAIHHQAGNYRVDVQGDQASAFCYATASHFRVTRSGRNTRSFVGSYDLHLLRVEGRWLIDLFRFNLKYIDGNRDLEREA